MLCKVEGGSFELYKDFKGSKSKIIELKMENLGLFVNEETYKRAYQEVNWSALTSLRKITIDGAKFIGLNITTELPNLEELEFKSSMIHADALENLLDRAPKIKKVNKYNSLYSSQKSFSRNKSITGKEKTLDERIDQINSQTTTEVMQTNNEDGDWINASDSSGASSKNSNRSANAKSSPSSVNSNSTLTGVREFSKKNETDINDENSSVFSGVSRDSQLQIGLENNLFDEEELYFDQSEQEFEEDEDIFDDISSQSTEIKVGVGPKPDNLNRIEKSKSTTDSESVSSILSSESLGNQQASMSYGDDVMSDLSDDVSELFDDPEDNNVTREFENYLQPFKSKARGKIGNFSPNPSNSQSPSVNSAASRVNNQHDQASRFVSDFQSKRQNDSRDRLTPHNSSNRIYSIQRESTKGGNSTRYSSGPDRSVAGSFKGKSSNSGFVDKSDSSFLRLDDSELYGPQIPTDTMTSSNQTPKNSRIRYSSSTNSTPRFSLPLRSSSFPKNDLEDNHGYGGSIDQIFPSSSSIIPSHLDSREFGPKRNNTQFFSSIDSHSVEDPRPFLNPEQSRYSNVQSRYQAIDILAQGRVEERSNRDIARGINKALESVNKHDDRSFSLYLDDNNKKVILSHHKKPVLEARSESVKVFKSLSSSLNELRLDQKASVVLGSLGIPPCPIEGIHVDTKGKNNELADQINIQFDALYRKQYKIDNPHSPQQVDFTVTFRNGRNGKNG